MLKDLNFYLFPPKPPPSLISLNALYNVYNNLTALSINESSFANKGNTSYGQDYHALYSIVGKMVYIKFDLHVKTLSADAWYDIFVNLPFKIGCPFTAQCFIGSDVYGAETGMGLRDVRFDYVSSTQCNINIFLWSGDSNKYIRSQMYSMPLV